MRHRWLTIIISLLIMVSGWLGAQTLLRVDQDLRVIYAEYTLAATDLGHVSGELIRYRTSVIRAVEADRQEEFQRIMAALPQKRARVNHAMERFVEATNDATLEKRIDARELEELRAVQERVQAYINSSHHALQLIEQRWKMVSADKAHHLQAEAKEYLAKDAGTKYMSVTLELDRLLEVVAAIAGEVKKEADSTLRMETTVLIAASVVLSLLVLAIPMKRP
jgi:hypothetical protein